MCKYLVILDKEYSPAGIEYRYCNQFKLDVGDARIAKLCTNSYMCKVGTNDPLRK